MTSRHEHSIGVIDANGLRALLGALGKVNPDEPAGTPEEQLEKTRKHFEDEYKKLFSEPCKGHGAAHEAMGTLLREMYKLNLLPEKAREPFIRLICECIFHRSAPDEMFSILQGDEFARVFFIAMGMAYAYESDVVKQAMRDAHVPGYL